MNSLDETAIADRLKTARRIAGLSQEDAARQLDVSSKTVARWESGETTGYLSDLARIAKVYGTTSEAILGTDGSSAEEAVAAQLTALRTELDEIRALLLDPKKLKKAADALASEPARKRR